MRVYIERFSEYNSTDLYEYLKTLFEEMNLWEKLENKKNILLKPNLLGAFIPEKAVTTHPIIIEAFIKILLEHNKNVWIGDSPGGTVSIEQTWEKTGIKQIADKYNVKLINFNKEGVKNISTPNNRFYLAEPFFLADAVINLPKYKTHGLTLFTGAIKNLYGVIPGLNKASYHKQYPNPNAFADVIVDLYSQLKDKVILHFMDGILGMEGEGPSAGNPKKFNIIFASECAVSLDYVASKMMGFNPLEIPVIQNSMKRLNLSHEDITISDEFKDFSFTNVNINGVQKKSNLLNKMPKFVKAAFQKLFDYYPAFTESCKQCNICVKSCPVNALSLNKNDKFPQLNKSQCIKCLCCHEMCPHHAVYIKKSFVARMFMR